MDSNKLIEVIKKIIRKEVRSTISGVIQETIKESVENHVNKLLAEKFVASVSSGQSIVKEFKKIEPSIDPRVEAKMISESRKKELLKKLGVENDSTANAIFEDVEMPSSEDDDEGIDLSQFGMRSR